MDRQLIQDVVGEIGQCLAAVEARPHAVVPVEHVVLVIDDPHQVGARGIEFECDVAAGVELIVFEGRVDHVLGLRVDGRGLEGDHLSALLLCPASNACSSTNSSSSNRA